MDKRTEPYRGKRLAGQTPPPAQETVTPPPAEQDTPAGQEKKKRSFWADYGYLLVTAAVVVLVFRVLLQLAYVPSSSMESTVPKDSLLLSWQLPYLVSDLEPRRGDVVTFWDEELGKLLVKRVIGLSGDEVSLSGGYVYVNGQRLEEPYLDQQGATDPAGSGQADFQVPEGCLFLLGDNRTGSLDSRYWSNPYIAYNNVRARVFLCIPIQFWHKIPLPQVGDISLIH